MPNGTVLNGKPATQNVIITVLLVLLTAAVTYAITVETTKSGLEAVVNRHSTEIAVAKSELCDVRDDYKELIGLIKTQNQLLAEIAKER